MGALNVQSIEVFQRENELDDVTGRGSMAEVQMRQRREVTDQRQLFIADTGV